MNSLLGLIIQIINLYQLVLLIYIIATWLISFNIVNTSNRFVYGLMNSLYRLCEPSLRLVRQYLPNLGSIDISPVILILGLMFLRNFVFEMFAPALF